MTPLRFLARCVRALAWFVVASRRILRAAPRDGFEYDLTHRYAHLLSDGFVRIFRIRHDIRNAEHLTAHQPCIYVANHRSNLDVITMAGMLPPRTIVIGKREIVRVPFLGTIFVRGGNVPINRRDSEQARLAIEEAERKLREDRVSIFLFPEGTRNYGRPLLPFKKGAFHLARNAKVPIVPMVCAATPGWLRGTRLYLASRVDVVIDVLEPVDPERFESVDALIAEVRERMRERLARIEGEFEAG